MCENLRPMEESTSSLESEACDVVQECVSEEEEEGIMEPRQCGEGALQEPPVESQRNLDEMITEESLLRSTICELENGLQESRKLLAQRDEEIRSLRQDLEKLRSSEVTTEDKNIIEVTLQEAQKRVLELESKVDNMREEINNFQNHREKGSESPCDGKQPCYCGSVCVAMKEVTDLKRKLHVTEQKYLYLKRNIRNSRERGKVRVGVAQRDSACVVS